MKFKNNDVCVQLNFLAQYNNNCIKTLIKNYFKEEIKGIEEKYLLKHFKTQLINFHGTYYVFIKKVY